MEIVVNCPVCELYQKLRDNSYKVNGGTLLTIDNDMTLIFDCQHRTKHSAILFFSNQKFDLLFESGLRAMQDKYYREAISSFSTSLERFYEYCIKVLLFDNKTIEAEKSWKLISKQSERQLGAFIVIFLKNTMRTPLLLPNKMVELRNNIIHKGYYPNKEETKLFASSVIQVINENFNLLKREPNNNISNYNLEYFNELKAFASKKIKEHNYYKKGVKVEPEDMFKNVLRPFSKLLPTFLSKLETEELIISELETYNPKLSTYYT